MSTADDHVLERIRAHAYRSLSPSSAATTNLSVDHEVWKEGEPLGPDFQELVARRPAVVVFADDDPHANFGHPCRYLLYDPDTGERHASLPARFPPWRGPVPDSVEPFHLPIPVVPERPPFHVRPVFRCPILIPEGNRYAILYSGMSNTRHLNDLEFGYRTLVHRYGFAPANITVLSFNGTTATQEGSNSIWPGDGTPYQIQVDGAGDQSAFEAAVDALKPKLGPEDLVFIHTNNHGDNFGNGSFLCTYPSYGTYFAADFSAKLAELPRYRALLVMMEQCNAGGFIAPILADSTAGATSVACAAIATESSYASADLHWDAFAYEWFAAQAGATPTGGALAFNPDTNSNGRIEATEAFNYAEAVDTSGDTPQYGDDSTAGGTLFLGREYTIWWWWCWILREVLEARWCELSESEYYEELHEIEPKLRELARSIDARSEELRAEVTTRVREIVGR